MTKTIVQANQVYFGRLASSPIGPLWVAVSEQGLVMVEWEMPVEEFIRLINSRLQAVAVYDEGRTEEAIGQLRSYLEGLLHDFSLPVDYSGMTPFQKLVLELTGQIPYGSTSTYKELAAASGHPGASRAVGRVEATNPMPIVIPCHRVLGSDGMLHGYGGPGGIKLKSWLLELEKSKR